MPIHGRGPAMTDVARVAQVSHQTVSRVLNGNPAVRPETRDRVLEAIQQLGYRRNLSARALATHRTQMIGVVALGTTFYGPASTLAGIEQAAREAGYLVTVVSLGAATRDAFNHAVDVLTGYAPDGLIAITPFRVAVEALDHISPDLPAVAVEGGEGTARVPVVCIDQEGGARQATSHLLELGHRTVHHVAGPADWLEAEARERGWRKALRDAGASLHEPIRGDWTARSGYEAGWLLAKRRRATAVFTANDQMALGMLRAFAEAGVRVPDDVSVVGFDNVPEAEFFPPPLTTMAQEFSEVGRRSVATLLEIIGGGVTELQVAIPPRLIIRSSTAPAGDGSREGGASSNPRGGRTGTARVPVVPPVGGSAAGAGVGSVRRRATPAPEQRTGRPRGRR